ncbi:MAG: M16 family metallopeptidase [bacterium]
MRLRREFFIVFFCFFIIFSFRPAQALVDINLESRVKEHVLKNGMKILIMERHQVPTVSLYIKFKVGNIDEEFGSSGTAHLLEHMLFKGTRTLGTTSYEKEAPLLAKIKKVGQAIDREKALADKRNKEKISRLSEELDALQKEHKQYVVKDEIDNLYSINGAVGFNASTSADITTYQVNLPSNRIELWARIESERILNPILREFYSERNVVMEERRQSYDSDPFRKLMEQFIATAFLAHPYRVPIIGWSTDIEFLDIEKTKSFFHHYYTPSNAVVAAVGDINAEAFIELMEKYFADIPSEPIPPRRITKEPEQVGERRVEVIFDAEPQLIIGYHKPALPHRDDYIFDIISGLLSDGRTSRLYEEIVEKKQLATSIDTAGSFPGSRDDNLFVLFATPRFPHTTQELEAAIYEELDSLKNEPVSDWELEKIKNQLQASLIRSLQSNSGMASKLSYFETIAGDWRYLANHPKIISQITKEEIMAAAQHYFKKSNRTVATLVSPNQQ